MGLRARVATVTCLLAAGLFVGGVSGGLAVADPSHGAGDGSTEHHDGGSPGGHRHRDRQDPDRRAEHDDKDDRPVDLGDVNGNGGGSGGPVAPTGTKTPEANGAPGAPATDATCEENGDDCNPGGSLPAPRPSAGRPAFQPGEPVGVSPGANNQPPRRPPPIPSAPVVVMPPAIVRTPPANDLATGAQPAFSYRAGYPESLRNARLPQVIALAAPGVAGMLVLTGVGGVVGYRQAKAGHAVRTGIAARFAN